MHRLKFGRSDYFIDTSVTALLSFEYTSRQTHSAGNVHILNCLFRSFTSGSDGGALCCTSVTCLLVESTSFFSCKTSSLNGGAIHFQNSNSGQSVLYRVCGNDCCISRSSSSWFQFAYIEVNNSGASNKNYVNYSSISCCVNGRSDSYYTLYLNYGKIFCPSVNMSMNKCGYYSGICCYPFYDASSVTCSISYSSFTDNIASDYICIYLNNGGSKHEMKHCNILRNSQVSSSYGIICANALLKIEDSCILENTGNCIFYPTSSTNTITLSNCTVDKTTNNGYLTIQNTVTKSFILGLNHISTQNCHSEYDSVGTLSAAPYVSRLTKKLFCYTSKINHCQATISDIFSLALVFMVALIHPSPPDNY
jgi:hypothetical protein